MRGARVQAVSTELGGDDRKIFTCIRPEKLMFSS
jgi:hypothetical protein